VDYASGVPKDYAAAIRQKWGTCWERCYKLASPREQRGSGWAAVLLGRMREVSVAIDAKKPREELIEKFQNFRQAFDVEFYNVDQELKDHCDQLAAGTEKVLEAVHLDPRI
jgi:hypothetical protein